MGFADKSTIMTLKSLKWTLTLHPHKKKKNECQMTFHLTSFTAGHKISPPSLWVYLKLQVSISLLYMLNGGPRLASKPFGKCTLCAMNGKTLHIRHFAHWSSNIQRQEPEKKLCGASILLTIYHHDVQSWSDIIQHMTHNSVETSTRLSF